jgi:hypothetical protein
MPEKNYCLYIHTNRENGKKYGVEHHADCRQQVVDELGISTGMFDMIRKSGQPYVPRGRSLNVHAALAGLEIRYA